MSESPTLAPPAALRGRRRRWLGTAGAALALALTGASAAHAAAPWGFEQVTPVNKGGGAVHPLDTFQTSPDGNGFLLTATSEFTGVPAESVPLYTRYFASRGVDGWSSRAMDPVTNYAGRPVVMSVLLASADVSHVLVASTLALAPGATPDGGNLYVRNTATGAYTLVATHEDIELTDSLFANQGNLNMKYLANDGRSALFLSRVPLVPGAPDTRANESEGFGLYSWTAEEGLRVVSVMPDSEGGGMVPIQTAVGGEADNGIRNAVPDSGGLDHVYFSPTVESQDGGGPAIGPVYVRNAGETKAVSVSRISGASGDPVYARVLATGRGGRYMFFKTNEEAFGASATPLTSDTPTDLGAPYFLYRYDAVEDSLAYVGALGQVRSTYAWQMSQDGRTIAFLSLLGLTPDAPAFDPEAPLQENLYVWRDGELRFVARGDEGAPLEGGNLRLLSPNGRYLAFTESSTGPLSAAARAGVDLGSPNADCQAFDAPAVCEQVFVYDVDTAGLECASCRTDGRSPTGESGDPGVTGKYMVRMGFRQVQTVADDGTAFFTTAQDLVESDANGLNDVYAYRDGGHRLLSRASQGMSARFLDATPDGSSVFIATNDPIAGTDNDRAVDVYLTREGTGFPYTPAIVDPPCTGGDCRGSFSPVEGLPLAGSVAFNGSGNPRPGGARLSVAGGKSIVGTVARLRVKVPGKGRVTVSGAGIRTARRSVSRAGTYTVRVALTAKARKALRRSKSARKRVRVTFTPADGQASKRTLSLTYKSKPANNRKGR
jgi:hypothetical protein